MLRTISILALLWICSAASMADAKPIFIKVFAPSSGVSASGGYSYGSSSGSTATASPINTQLISNLISTKIQLLNSVLQAKSSGGGFGFGFNKFVSFSSSTTTTERPVTHHTTEVNTDFTPEDSSTQTTQTVYTTTTEGDIETPKPTVHPGRPVSTSTTEVITGESTTVVAELTSTTRAPSGYTYTSPTPYATSTLGTYYLPSSLA
ncbi:mucin-5AC isoform X1 [Drosophila subobscura]|uniref:mucin-5AC isoform X1 n=1 Tax=Drosophila subobscura TaxID=7241 RepID=UPI00155A40B1|nr:mucin-5AC isoform X1 [Drosophila subobscura]